MLELLEVMRYVQLCMLEVMEGVGYVLMRCVLELQFSKDPRCGPCARSPVERALTINKLVPVVSIILYLHSHMECTTGVICPFSMPLYSSSHAS